MSKFYLVIVALTLSTISFGKIKVGQTAPDIIGVSPSGQEYSLLQFRGKVVLVDFWASWCPHCRTANQDYVEYYNRYHSLGLEIFSVSLDQDLKAWEAAINEDSLTWPNHVCDGKGLVYSKAAIDYDILGTPTTFLIDELGKVIAIDLPYNQLDEELKWLFEEQAFFYPHKAADTVFFSHTSKYKLINSEGEVLAKGKGDFLNVKNTKDGIYQLKLDGPTRELIIMHRDELPISFSIDKALKSISLSTTARYEIHSHYGRLLTEGESNKIDLSDLGKSQSHPYYLIINGKITKFYWN